MMMITDKYGKQASDLPIPFIKSSSFRGMMRMSFSTVSGTVDDAVLLQGQIKMQKTTDY